MTAVTATYRNGQIVFDDPLPADWVEGMRVLVEPTPVPYDLGGIRDEDWPTTPEGIAELLKVMDEVEGSWLSPEDEAEWKRALAERKAWELANWETHSKKIENLFR